MWWSKYCYTICIELHWEVIFLWKETTWSTFALITGTIIDIFNVVFTPFYLLKPVLQAIYKFWVWKKKQGPWPKLEKCMKINTCKCINYICRVHTESWILEKVLKLAQQFSRPGKSLENRGKVLKKMVKSLECFVCCIFFKLASALSIMSKSFFFIFVKSYSISPVRLQCIMKKALFPNWLPIWLPWVWKKRLEKVLNFGSN